MKEGDEVYFYIDLETYEGKITKIENVKATINTPKGIIYNVPLTQLSKK